MTSAEWLGLKVGVAAAVGVATLVRMGFRGGQLRQTQRWSFTCPELQEHVEGRLVQDVRTGQYTGVRACSAMDQITCGQECVRRLNLGFPLSGAARGRRRLPRLKVR
jgi:hypothetical protein